MVPSSSASDGSHWSGVPPWFSARIPSTYMRPTPMLSWPPVARMWKPSGVVRGTTARPSVSIVPAWRRRESSATHSFQSESS